MTHPRDDGRPERHTSLSYDVPLIVLMIAGIVSRDPKVNTVVAGLALIAEPTRRSPSPRG